MQWRIQSSVEVVKWVGDGDQLMIEQHKRVGK